jgi:hypothetical protein
MGVSGLMIWFKMDVTQFLPRWAVDVALTLHYYEAVLACLAIVVWHFYHVIFDPDVYPLNPSCWDGKVSERWQAEEHPLEVSGAKCPAFAEATAGGQVSGDKVGNIQPSTFNIQRSSVDAPQRADSSQSSLRNEGEPQHRSGA